MDETNMAVEAGEQVHSSSLNSLFLCIFEKQKQNNL